MSLWSQEHLGGRLPPGVQVGAEALSTGLVHCDVAFPMSCPQWFPEYRLPSWSFQVHPTPASPMEEGPPEKCSPPAVFVRGQGVAGGVWRPFPKAAAPLGLRSHLITVPSSLKAGWLAPVSVRVAVARFVISDVRNLQIVLIVV
ncbi:unnamed protein product [Rangifer tarandus platyrhynchus]|uniref:Uncharacterized protein n=2 Tax=Rangifer tarandus platyrhynchus TaxID=3082113 RepID=A0ABN8YWZ5_RANTA|nr:unnamed protein product [Rangifer tarandus platyrhynchus]